jgi:hypothetical protein
MDAEISRPTEHCVRPGAEGKLTQKSLEAQRAQAWGFFVPFSEQERFAVAFGLGQGHCFSHPETMNVEHIAFRAPFAPLANFAFPSSDLIAGAGTRERQGIQRKSRERRKGRKRSVLG